MCVSVHTHTDDKSVSACVLIHMCSPPPPPFFVLEIDIVMSSLLFMLITYYSVMTDTNEHD